MSGSARLRASAVACGLSVGLLLLPSRPCAAAPAMKPSHARADVEAAMRERGFTFCSKPAKPLSTAARALCPHAASLPECAGFAEACGAQEPESDSPFLRKLGRVLASFIPDFVKNLVSVLTRLPAVLFLVLVAAIVVAALLAVARSMRGRRFDAALREPTARPATADEELSDLVETTDAETLLALADGHARGGENDLALQLYLAASLRALDRRGAVLWSKNRTNGEYVRACADEPSRGPLRELVRETDRVQFGRVTATGGVVARAAELAAGIVRWVPIVALVLALPGLAGCGGTRDHRAGDDPAGDEVLYELLKRQGVRVDALDGPLGSLPTAPGQLGPAVIVDAATTPLDDETRAHLAGWVHAGGVLVLAGDPEAWPRAFGAKPKTSASGAFSAWTRPHGLQTPAPFRGRLVDPAAFEIALEPEPDAPADENDLGEVDDDRPEAVETLASFEDGAIYAAAWRSGRGLVLGLGSDELMTNAGLVRPGNAAALVAILSHANRDAFAIAEPEDGTAPPSSPITSLRRAGLGLALGQGLAAALVLFFATGVRLAAPKPPSPPRRRAFAEHVQAVGALYARTGAAHHALTSYARFVEQRLRARMPRGAVDVAAYLASRSQLPLDVCERLFQRATAGARGTEAAPAQAGTEKPRRGEKQTRADDLVILKELSAAYAAATAQDP